VVTAFVTLRPGHEADAALERDVRAHARRRLGPAVAPRRVEFRASLPKNQSGKILRRLLKTGDARGRGEASGSRPPPAQSD